MRLYMRARETGPYRKNVMRAHNIEITEEGFMCNDGDIFKSIWEALDHTIWLDLCSRHLKYKKLNRNVNDYYEILNGRPSGLSIQEGRKVICTCKVQDWICMSDDCTCEKHKCQTSE